MAKRGPQSELTDRNWNDEEESEEAGHFTQAPQEELKKRVIRTARRRITAEAGNSDSGSNSTAAVFSAFKGFTGATSTPAIKTTSTGSTAAPNPSPFAFLSSIAKAPSGGGGTTSAATATAASSISSTTTSATTSTTTATTSAGIFSSIGSSESNSKKIFTGFGSPTKLTPTGADTDKPKSDTTDGNKTTTDAYITNIKALNESVAKWISDKVKENPLCKLTPIFKDYEKYLDEIESKKADGSKPSGTEIPGSTTTQAARFTGSIFAGVPAATSTTSPSKSTLTTPSTTAKPAFSFGTSVSTTGGFTFANVVKPTAAAPDNTTDKAEDAEGDEAPPKVEFTPVEEKDSVFSKRCKLFVKAAGSFSDRGVGTLHIKPVGEKIQLLVRADTSLGNILLNIILNETVPLQRMGKNNVMLICLPTPESKPPPTPVLLRVKTTEEADELFETLNKYKSKK